MLLIYTFRKQICCYWTYCTWKLNFVQSIHYVLLHLHHKQDFYETDLSCITNGVYVL